MRWQFGHQRSWPSRGPRQTEQRVGTRGDHDKVLRAIHLCFLPARQGLLGQFSNFNN